MHPFDLEEYAYNVAKDELPNFLEDENSPYDYERYKDDYALRFRIELEKFFDTNYGLAFSFDNNDFAEKGTKAYELINDAKKDFMLDVYHYASFDDFLSFHDYKKSADNNNALNYLSHIPYDFHLKFYKNNRDLFESIYGDLLYKDLESKVEELFFKLHNEVYDKFLSKDKDIRTTLPLFIPYDLNETAFLAEHYDLKLFDLKNANFDYFYENLSNDTKQILKQSLILEDIGEVLLKNAKKDLEQITLSNSLKHINIQENNHKLVFIQDEEDKNEFLEALKGLEDETLAHYIEKHDFFLEKLGILDDLAYNENLDANKAIIRRR